MKNYYMVMADGSNRKVVEPHESVDGWYVSYRKSRASDELVPLVWKPLTVAGVQPGIFYAEKKAHPNARAMTRWVARLEVEDLIPAEFKAPVEAVREFSGGGGFFDDDEKMMVRSSSLPKQPEPPQPSKGASAVAEKRVKRESKVPAHEFLGIKPRTKASRAALADSVANSCPVRGVLVSPRL